MIEKIQKNKKYIEVLLLIPLILIIIAFLLFFQIFLINWIIILIPFLIFFYFYIKIKKANDIKQLLQVSKNLSIFLLILIIGYISEILLNYLGFIKSPGLTISRIFVVYVWISNKNFLSLLKKSINN